MAAAMELGQLCTVLQACMSPDPTSRKQAEAALTQFQHAPGQLVNLLRVAAEDSLEPSLRQVAAIAFKNIVKRDWEDLNENNLSKIPGADKQAIRENILEAIVRAPQNVRVQLGEVLRAMVYEDFPERWPNLLQLIVQNFATQDQARLYGALYVLRVVTRKYEFRDEEERAPLADIVNTTFPLLLHAFQALLASESAAVEVADLLKLVCKTFWSATYMGVPALLLQPDQFAGWMTCIHTLLVRPVPQEGQPADAELRAAWPWWKAKKWVLHITYRLFNRYGDAKMAKDEREKAFSAAFQKQCSGRFLEAHLHLLAGIAQGTYISPRVVNLALQYVSHALVLGGTWRALKAHVGQLLAAVVFPLLCFNDEDEELWRDDPAEYIRKGYDIIEDMYSPKTAAMNFVHELCKVRPKGNLETLMGLVVQTFADYAASAATAATGGGAVPPELARRMDGALLAVGAMSDVLKKKEPYRTQLEPMLISHVLPLFSAPAGHLRAKACWVAGQYADIDFAAGGGKGPAFTTLFQRVVASLRDPDLPVRVDAVVAIRSFIDAYDEDEVAAIKPLIPQLLDEFFKLMNEVDNEDLVFTLETLVEKFGEEMAPYAIGLAQHLAAAFWRLQAGEAEGEEEDEEELGALAAFGCLRALSTVLESVSSLSHLFPALEDILWPIMQRMCSEEGQDVFEEILELVSYFTYYSPQISPRMWSLWPQLHSCFMEWGVDYFENILVPLDNFISRGTHTFLHPGPGQPNYLAQANQMVERVLTDADMSEEDTAPAPKLLEVILQHCRGGVDACVGGYLRLALGRLAGAQRRGLRDLLVNVVANCLHYNAPLTLRELQAQGALVQFFSTWYRMITEVKKGGEHVHFRRASDKKINVLGIAAVLAAPDDALPAEVAAGLPQLLAGALHLLTALKQQLDEAAQAEDEEESAEEEESETDEEGSVDLGAEDSRELGDEDDQEGDGAYLARLAREARRARNEAGSGSDSDSEDWDDEEDEVSSPLDEVDPFILFADTLRALQSAHPARFQAVLAQADAAAQAALQAAMQAAEERRRQPAPAAAAPA